MKIIHERITYRFNELLNVWKISSEISTISCPYFKWILSDFFYWFFFGKECFIFYYSNVLGLLVHEFWIVFRMDKILIKKAFFSSSIIFHAIPCQTKWIVLAAHIHFATIPNASSIQFVLIQHTYRLNVRQWKYWTNNEL